MTPNKLDKDTYYFPHDYHARSDRKLLNLFFKYGLTGIGAYWCIIEMLYEQGGYIELTECDSIANELRTQCDMVSDILSGTFNLFKNDGKLFWSESALRRLASRQNKSEQARKSAIARWNSANAMPPQCDTNAIKGKESILNNNIYIIYSHWNDKKIVVHKTLTDKIKTKCKAALKDYSIEDIKKAIDNYAEVMNHQDEYYWTYKWVLADFLQRGLERFMDNASPLKNFLRNNNGKSNKVGQVPTEAELEADLRSKGIEV